MDKLTIDTTQNVTIEYEIGSLGDRILATIIDVLILFGYYIFMAIITGILGQTLGKAFYILFLIIILPVLFYPLLCETFMNGQSFGKRARKIKVIRIDGRQASFGNYLMRWLIGLIEVNFYGVIALITIVINGKGQRLGDMAAGTAVIKLKPGESIGSTAFTQVEETYIPVFPQVSTLSDTDAGTIRQVLLLNDIENEYIIKDKLAAKIKDLLKISSILDSDTFLKIVLKDFNKINGTIE
jgi:uncharacterized RDD family membrane protein YckC